MSSTADRADLITEVEDHLRGVAKVVRRAMLDAMPDGEPVQWLYGPMREYPSRPGKALAPGVMSFGEPSVRRGTAGGYGHRRGN